MRSRQYLILMLFLAAQVVVTAGLGDRLVLCIGPHGHVAIEQADHDDDCDHGCPGEADEKPTIAESCETDHCCTDIGLTLQLTDRLRSEKKVSAPPLALTPTQLASSESTKLESVSRSMFYDYSRGLPSSPPYLRTVVLRL